MNRSLSFGTLPMRNGLSRAVNVIEPLVGTSVAPERANAISAPIAPSPDKDVQKKETALKEARKRERHLRQELADSNRQRERIQRELQAVYASYSWHITAPIRALLNHVLNHVPKMLAWVQ